MKPSFLKQTFPAVIALSLIITSCDKNNDVKPEPPAPEKSIAQIVTDDTSFSYLLAAAVKAGLDGALSSPGTLTVFAPTNDAFRNAGFATAADVSAADAAVLGNILNYHILSSEVISTSVPEGPNASVATLGGLNIFTTRNSSGVFINGTKVNTADVQASNGVVHVIGKVLIPPSGNIVETAVANPDFSYLVAAVLRASTGATDVAAVLSADDVYTVFAPTNQAFINAGFTTIDDINAADPDVLASILTYHTIAGRIFSSDLTNGAEPVTLNGGAVQINLTAGVSVKGNSNTAPSDIIATDIVASNGVIHVIDEVLLP